MRGRRAAGGARGAGIGLRRATTADSRCPPSWSATRPPARSWSTRAFIPRSPPTRATTSAASSAAYFELEAGRTCPPSSGSKGISAGDIEFVILTHLHVDHASAISEFPERDLRRSAPGVGGGDRGASPDPARLPPPATTTSPSTTRTVDFDADFIASYGPFGRTFDLFGDGSVRLVFTPGHSAGPLSVILRLPRRDFVIAGDVAYTWRQLQGGPGALPVADRHNWRRSLRELQAYREAYPYALVVPGHDPEFWAKLDARYEE